MMIITSNPNKKGNKHNKIIAALIVGIIAVSIFIAVMVGNFVKNDAEESTTVPTTEAQETISDIVIEDDITDEAENSETTTEKGIEIIQLQEPETEKVTTTQKPTQQTTTAKPAEPVTQVTTTQGNYMEIVDSGNDSVDEYSCGSKGHHCDSKETHNFIVSLEKKGCSYCGSHSCKSFYTYDEWGNACYDPTKCESYNAKSDPCEYCQECGKKVGTGSGSTCVRFTVDTKCPECGKSVKGKTCHSH